MEKFTITTTTICDSLVVTLFYMHGLSSISLQEAYALKVNVFRFLSSCKVMEGRINDGTTKDFVRPQ